MSYERQAADHITRIQSRKHAGYRCRLRIDALRSTNRRAAFSYDLAANNMRRTMGRHPPIKKSWETTIPPVKGRIIDLSLGINNGAPTYKGFAECSLARTHTLASDSFNLTKLTINTHGTTHLDAPSHFLETGKTVDQLDLSKCIGPALMINLDHKGPKDPVVVADLQAYADAIIPNSRVLMRFGWDGAYPDPRYFTDHPYLTLEVAKWFASRRDRKSTRLNSSHGYISYAVFCLNKKN